MRAPGPYLETIPIIWSTVMYCMENSSAFMPSFTQDRLGHDKSTIRRHFPGWPFFGMTPKLLTWRFGSGKRRGIKGTMDGDLRSQIIVNYGRVLTSRRFVRLDPPSRLKAQPKTVLKPIKDIRDSLSIGVPGQIPSKFRDVQGTQYGDWMEGGGANGRIEGKRKKEKRKENWVNSLHFY